MGNLDGWGWLDQGGEEIGVRQLDCCEDNCRQRGRGGDGAETGRRRGGDAAGRPAARLSSPKPGKTKREKNRRPIRWGGSAAVFVSIVLDNQPCGVLTELMPPQRSPVNGVRLLPLNIAVTGPLR